ncbi:MAG: hypothetical protein EA353_07130 [Puniceicoccaceae bacterium]|nr:MAG: hypothetical protein EA353_07130 [Puniceicoccaceae bacterium]
MAKQTLGRPLFLGARKTQLQSDLIPSSTGADPFERMAQQALLADARLVAGEITVLERMALS